MDSRDLSAFLVCHLIALDKCPGVRPIGICETAHRIIVKAIVYATKGSIQAKQAIQVLLEHGSCVLGRFQVFRLQFKSVTDAFHYDDIVAVLLVNTSNAFNSVNREVALRNIQYVCPALEKVLINTYMYRAPIDLFVDSTTQFLEEGTTQDLVAMLQLPSPS